MSKETISKTYHLFTYKDIWDQTKKKYNLSDAELRHEIEISLQMWAWSDIITESVEYHLKSIANASPSRIENKEEARY